MRIVHVAQFLGIGGLEKIIFHLAHEQLTLGHQVEIYIYDHERSWVEYFRKSGLIVHTPILKKNGYDFSLLKRMNQDLSSFDIVHTHDLNPLMYLGPLMLWKKITFQRRPKLIHTTHGLDHIENYPRGKLYQQIFSRLADKIIAVSEKIGHFYTEEIGLHPKKVSVIPNGIATYKSLITPELKSEKRQWLADKHHLSLEKPIILSLSRIVPLKDQKFLIRTIKERPHLQLLVAGPASDQQYYDELKLLEDQNIKLIGPQELVSDYNLGSDLYVSASTHEGIPVAVLEAMAVETPCLVSDIPGHLTLLKHGPEIDIFKINNKDDFLQKLDFIFADPEALQKKSIRARKVVEQHYSVKNMVEKYMQEYDS